MSEQVNVFDIDDPVKMKSVDRDEFYIEQKHNWVTGYVEVIHVFLFTEKGELIVQKRANHKNHNPWLLDKSIWGHMKTWDTPSYTAMIETVQELLVPSIVAQDIHEFNKILREMSSYLDTSAVLTHVDTFDAIMPKIIDWVKVDIANRSHLYFGVYKWRIRNADSETKWVLFYEIDELKNEIETSPESFTCELGMYVSMYGDRMKKFIEETLPKIT